MLDKYTGTISHAIITIAAMIGAHLLGYSAVIAGALTVAYWLGREMAQAEERYMSIKRINRAMAPCCMVLKREAWTVKGILDWALPAGAVIIFGVKTYVV